MTVEPGVSGHSDGAAAVGDGKIRNVIFDLGGVLLDWNPERILGGFYADPALRASLQQSLFLHPEWRALNRGELTEADFLARAEQRTGRDGAELSALLDSMRESLITKPDTVALLQSLHRRGVPLYCLSDMPISVYAYLRVRHDFWSAFSGIVISAEVRMAKPDREIFDHLLTRFKLRPEQTVFIDDLQLSVDGAIAAGLYAIQFRDAVQCTRDLDALLAR
jgi:HAD superfamily hydrolase (TIGR01509 family)